MQPTCTSCGIAFSIDAAERDFYRRMEVCEPTDCPACRRQQRLVFRNFFNLYHRTCSLTARRSFRCTTAAFRSGVRHARVVERQVGRTGVRQAVDPAQPFLAQVSVLHATVPRMNIVNSQSENTDYCCFSMRSRNCYLVFGNVEKRRLRLRPYRLEVQRLLRLSVLLSL